MGGPMAHRLIEAGHEVRVFDADANKVEEVVAHGGAAALSAADAAAGAEFFFTSLPRPDHVIAVLRDAGALAALEPGSIWVDLTTNRKELVEELAEEAPEGVGVVDSPVTGAVDGARNGRLTLFVGGASELVERVTPLLDTLGTVIACGGLGTGNVVKLVTNQLWFIHSAAIGEGFALGQSHGVALEVLYSAIRQSVGDSFVAAHDAPSIFAGHYDPSFTLNLCNKDLGLIDELQADVKTELPLTNTARGVFKAAAETYGPDSPELYVAKNIEDTAGLSFRVEGDWTPPWEVTDEATVETAATAAADR